MAESIYTYENYLIGMCSKNFPPQNGEFGGKPADLISALIGKTGNRSSASLAGRTTGEVRRISLSLACWPLRSPSCFRDSVGDSNIW